MNSSLPDYRELKEKFLYFVFNPVNIFVGDKQTSFYSSQSCILWGFPPAPPTSHNLPRGGGQRAWSKEMLLVEALQFTPCQHEAILKTAVPNGVLNNSRAVVPNITSPFPWPSQREPALPSGWGISTNFPSLQRHHSPFDSDPTHKNPQHLFLFSV